VTFKEKLVHHKLRLKIGNSEWAFVRAYIQQVILIWLFVRDLFEMPKT